MVCRIEYKSSLYRDLKHLDKATADKILSQIGELLSDNPGVGERLQREFSGLYKLRLDEYRVIYAKIGKDRVLVLRIGHRSKVYE